MLTQQLTDSSPTPQPLPPTLVICRRCGLSSHSWKGSIPLTDPLGWKWGEVEPVDVFPAKIILSSLPLLQAKVRTDVGLAGSGR